MPLTEVAHDKGLAIHDLACARGGQTLFAGLSFELRGGGLLQVRGSNGSGKSSLLRLLGGLQVAAAGAICWNGQAIGSAAAAYGRALAFLGHQLGISRDLSARENLDFALRLGGDTGNGVASAAMLDRFGLAAAADLPARRLSQGQRQRLALARVGLSRRPLWLLDEPCAALDAQGEQLFDRLLLEHLQQGGLAVVTTHRRLDLPAQQLQGLQTLDMGRRPICRPGPPC